jgi:RHS repeat-associated protein
MCRSVPNSRTGPCSKGGGITTHTWDDENRRTRVALPSGVLNTSTYNGDGLRVTKQDSSGTTNFVWDGQAYLLEYTDTDATIFTQEPSQYGGLVSQAHLDFSDPIYVPHYYLHHALGSTAKLTDAAAQVTDSYLYKAFGEILQSSGTTRNPFLWVGSLGYYADLDLLDYYLRARVYWPAIARFLSPDPIGFAGDPSNPYRYVANSVSQFLDPSGMQAARWFELRLNIVHWTWGAYTTDQHNADVLEARKILAQCCITIRRGWRKYTTSAETGRTLMIQKNPPLALYDPSNRAMKNAMRAKADAPRGDVTAHYVPFIVRGAAGVLMTTYESSVIARVGRSGQPRQRFVLAHELVHALGLFHDEVKKDVNNLMLQLEASDIDRYPGLRKRWQEFQRTYKGPRDSEWASFVYGVTANAANLRQDQCDDMRARGIANGVLHPINKPSTP